MSDSGRRYPGKVAHRVLSDDIKLAAVSSQDNFKIALVPTSFCVIK